MVKKDRSRTMLRIITICALLMLFPLPALSANASETIDATLIEKVIPENLTPGSTGFVFSGDHILWKNSGAENPGSGTGLYLFSVKENSTRRIDTETAGNTWIQGQTLSGDLVLWNEYPGIIHAYSISSGRQSMIPDPAVTGIDREYSRNGISEIARWDPVMQGDRIAWLQGFSSATYGDSDIAVLNLTTNEGYVLDVSSLPRGGLVMSSDHIAWYTWDEKQDGTGTNITLRDLRTGTDTIVCPGPGLHIRMALSDKYLAWTDIDDPLAFPRIPSQITLYTISSGTIMKIPVTTMDQSDPILAGDYVIYTECSHPGKDTGRRTCESRIFDIRKEKILEFASSENVQISKDFEYPRKIDGFSKGIFLIEEIRNGEREFGLYRINNLPQTGIPVIPTKVGQETIRENKPAAEKPGPSGSSTPSLPGFAIILPILAFSLVAITRHFRFL